MHQRTKTGGDVIYLANNPSQCLAHKSSEQRSLAPRGRLKVNLITKATVKVINTYWGG